MTVKIRLARGGSKKKPFYRIVAADVRAPRDGRFLEKLGTYNPLLDQSHEERIVLNIERVKHWLSVGAKPTDRVAKFLGHLEITDKPSIADQPKKSQPKKKAMERLEAKAAAEREAEEAKKAAAEEASAE